MRPFSRSLAGFGIAAVMVPVFVGLVACLPVPIGNPEKSRIDTQMVGVWFEVLNENLWLIEPYDRRTFLVTLYDFEPVNCVQSSDRPGTGSDSGTGHPDPEKELIAAERQETDIDANAGAEITQGIDPIEEIVIEFEPRPDGYPGDPDPDTALAWYKDFIIEVRQDCDGDAAYREVHKAWLTELGRRDFLTIEPTGMFNDRAEFGTDTWFVWRISRSGSTVITLEMIDSSFDGFDDIAEERKAYEAVIRRHANNPELTDDELILVRVPRHDLEFFADSIGSGPADLLLED